MTKEIIGFINKNNDVFNLRDDSSASKYCSKVGQGHENKIATFTEDGDLKDSGKTIEDLVTKIQPSANGNLALLDENGNLIDSEYAPDDFAAADHGHKEIEEKYGASKRAKVYCAAGENTNPAVYISIKTSPTTQKSVQINGDNIDNLDRALEDPVKSTDTTPTYDDSKLITAGGVASALSAKSTIIYENEDGKATIGVGTDPEEGGEIDLTVKKGSDVQKSASIVAANIDNLNRALRAPDGTPEEDSDELITSGAVYAALAEKMDTKTIDSTPADNATHLISSKAVYDELAKKAYVNGNKILIEKDSNGTTFSLTNDVKYWLEDFVKNNQEGKPIITSIEVFDNEQELGGVVYGVVIWARRQMTTTKIDVSVYIGTKHFRTSATVPEDSLDTFTWESAWTYKDYASRLTPSSNS